MKRMSRALLCLLVGLAPFSAFADDHYPSKPIHLIVPFPPAGGTDILSRLVANKLTETMKWSIIVENRPGAGGNIGVDVAARAPHDGYTIVMGQTSNLAINPTLFAHLPYSPAKDFSPITTVASAPLVLVVATNSPFKSLAEIVDAAKAKPGQVSFGSPGNGTVAHMTIELLQKASGVKFQHIAYKGSSQAITDLIGGYVQVFMSSIPTAIAQIKGGRMRAIAVTSTERSSDLPNVPTINESGYKGFDAATWFGLLAPAGTPPEIIAKLNQSINQVLNMPDVQKRIDIEGATTLGSSPEQFRELLKSDMVRWGQVVKESGAKVD
ncbi:MAG TPA: tripartite tricarboxylate transporter substrate binding protein [Telluria sp.]|nr:tripartite tricarboxylate transporter substrate binding protein [Telluria sp.]